VKCSDFENVPGRSLWLPRRCEVSHYRWESKPKTVKESPLIVETYIVSRVSGAPLAQDDFRVEINIPGTDVSDASLPGAENKPDKHVHYTFPANRDELDAAIKGEFPVTASRHLRWRVIAVNVAMLLIMLGVLVSRRLRKTDKRRDKP